MAAVHRVIEAQLPAEPGEGAIVLDEQGVAWQRGEAVRTPGGDVAWRRAADPNTFGQCQASWAMLLLNGRLTVVWDPDAPTTPESTDLADQAERIARAQDAVVTASLDLNRARADLLAARSAATQ